jgi:cytoskeletal protein CcmA (bactofilin family)
MFKKSNNKNTTLNSPEKSIPRDSKPMKAPSNSVPSIISSDVVVKGNVSTSGEIQLDGTIEGDVKSKNLTIGENGTVKGKVTADDVIVKGSVNGSIVGRNVRLEKSAKLNGDICHQTLSIEAGAYIEGNLTHQSASSNAAPGNVTKVMSADPDEKKDNKKEVKTKDLADRI